MKRASSADRVLDIIVSLKACDRTNGEIAKMQGVSRQHVERLMKKLKVRGLIEPSGVAGHTTTGPFPTLWRLK